jgi:dienelactone hydrolase
MSTPTSAGQGLDGDRQKQELAYGEWPSPIGVDMVAADSGTLSWPSVSGDETWWCQSDPSTATVQLFHCLPGGPPVAVLEPSWSVGNKSLGYGGRPYLVVTERDGQLVVFTNQADQRIYRLTVADLADGATNPEGVGASPVPITPVDPSGWTTYYADPILSPARDEIWCVRERCRAATGPDDADPAPRTARDIVAIPLDGRAANDPAAVRVVATSHHFLSGVRASPDGQRLAWIGWNHPAMPWDGTELMVAELADGVARDPRPVLGGDNVSVPQAEWAGPNTLYAMADPAGWWNLHRIELGRADADIDCVLPLERDCAGAIWRVGSTWFAVTAAGVVLRDSFGEQRISLWRPGAASLVDLAPGWTEFHADLQASGLDEPEPVVVTIAASVTHDDTVLRIAIPPAATTVDAPLACTRRTGPDVTPWVPAGQRRIARGVDGREVHYVYFPPTNPGAHGPAGEQPPLLVHAHGGPTSNTTAKPDLEFAMFCSRGFAIASVDYGGSTGYGREYRNRLRRNWGIVDVEDCVSVAADLAARGLADAQRTAIRGGSAGGWTSLACLTSTEAFCAGAVYYPISDAYTWSGGQTHDFESQYIRSLVGELPADRERFDQVSPLGKVDRISRPLVMLQGAADFICKPDQAQRIVDAVAARGLWHRYLVFDGEGHGFRKESSVAASLRAEAELYSTVMGIAVNPDA